jgi:hypothetical protein
MRAALLWAAVLFLLAQLAGGALLDYHWQAIRFPSAGIVLAHLENKRPPFDIVCLGSSRFMHGLREGDLEQALQQRTGRPVSVLNAAVPSGDQVSSVYMLDQILEKEVRPAFALIEVSPESLNHCNSWLRVHVQRQLGWQDIPQYWRDVCLAGQFSKLAQARLLPLFVHRRQLCQDGYEFVNAFVSRHYPWKAASPTDKRNVIVVDELTDRIRKAHATPLEGTQQGVSQVLTWLRNYQVGGTAAACLEQLIQHCEQQGIRVVLIAPPVTKLHRRTYTPEINAAFLAYMRQLTDSHHCPFLDYRARLPDKLFLDNHHLLAEGSVRLCRLIADEVLTLE